MLNAYTLYFDAAGGSCSEVSREVSNSTAIDELPTPTRENYSFTGWHLTDGTLVTEETVFSTGLDQTVYAVGQKKPSQYILMQMVEIVRQRI